MKYSEFKAEVEKLGFVVEDEGVPIYVDKSKDGETLVSIGKHKRFWLDPGWSGFNNLTEDQQLKLYDLAYQLAKTPLAEREEEKRYRLRLDLPLVKLPYYLYRNVHTGVTGITILENSDHADYQMEFTSDELLGLNRNGFKLEVVG